MPSRREILSTGPAVDERGCPSERGKRGDRHPKGLASPSCQSRNNGEGVAPVYKVGTIRNINSGWDNQGIYKICFWPHPRQPHPMGKTLDGLRKGVDQLRVHPTMERAELLSSGKVFGLWGPLDPIAPQSMEDCQGRTCMWRVASHPCLHKGGRVRREGMRVPHH